MCYLNPEDGASSPESCIVSGTNHPAPTTATMPCSPTSPSRSLPHFTTWVQEATQPKCTAYLLLDNVAVQAGCHRVQFFAPRPLPSVTGTFWLPLKLCAGRSRSNQRAVAINGQCLWADRLRCPGPWTPLLIHALLLLLDDFQGNRQLVSLRYNGTFGCRVFGPDYKCLVEVAQVSLQCLVSSGCNSYSLPFRA